MGACSTKTEPPQVADAIKSLPLILLSRVQVHHVNRIVLERDPQVDALQVCEERTRQEHKRRCRSS